MNDKYLSSIIGGLVHSLPTLEDELAKLTQAQLCHRWSTYAASGHRCFVLKELHLIRSACHASKLAKLNGSATLVYGSLYRWTPSEAGKKVA